MSAEEGDLAKKLAEGATEELFAALREAGYVILKRKSYDALRRRATVAEALLEQERENTKHAHLWGEHESERTRYLSDRLDRVIAAAASQGVTIFAINKALDEVKQEASNDPK